MTNTTERERGLVNDRVVGALPDASPEVRRLWTDCATCVATDLPAMGLAAGERPVADVEVLAGAVAVAEYELARRMHAARAAGALPLAGPGEILTARGWGAPAARRLARAGALAASHPRVAKAWSAGIITADHVDAIARNVGALTDKELAAVIAELGARWGKLSPAGVARFLVAAGRLLHPPADDDDPEQAEIDAYEARDLSFGVLGDTVVLSGALPRVEGEVVMAAIDALAERLRSTAEHTPAGARRADALVELVNAAAGAGALPSRGGLPVALSVTLDHTRAGDPLWATSRGHQLTESEARFVACDPTITPIVVDDASSANASASAGRDASNPSGAEAGRDASNPSGAEAGRDASNPSGAEAGRDADPAAPGCETGDPTDACRAEAGRDAADPADACRAEAGRDAADPADACRAEAGSAVANGAASQAASPTGQPCGSGPSRCDGHDGRGDSSGTDAAAAAASCGPTRRTADVRITALAALLFDGPRIPLAVGRTARTATTAQRKALAARDGGCIMPGCTVTAENSQVHHVHEWAAGGATDLANCVLLCWAHHRQVDMRMWAIEPATPDLALPTPEPGAPVGTPWPGNNRSPWVIRRTPRSCWRL